MEWLDKWWVIPLLATIGGVSLYYWIKAAIADIGTKEENMTKAEVVGENRRLQSELVCERGRNISFIKKISKLEEKIKELEELCEVQQKVIDRQNRLLTENELYEKKIKEFDSEEGVSGKDVLTRLARLEAKCEAEENPRFF